MSWSRSPSKILTRRQSYIMLIRPVFYRLLAIVLGKVTDISSIDGFLDLSCRCLEVAQYNMRILVTLSNQNLLGRSLIVTAIASESSCSSSEVRVLRLVASVFQHQDRLLIQVGRCHQTSEPDTGIPRLVAVQHGQRRAVGYGDERKSCLQGPHEDARRD